MVTGTYLDYNATAPTRPEAAAAVTAALAFPGNPSSVHSFGRAARRCVEGARQAVAPLAGARPQDIVFTSGGTEANHLALHGTGRRRILVSAGEHDSVLRAVPGAQMIALRPDGIVDLKALRDALKTDGTATLVSVMLANNETGILQPVREVVDIARQAGALVHCDAVQAAGKVPLDFEELGVDLMSLSAHKLGGPAGVGALVVRGGLEVAAAQRGGGQERGHRAGTENLSGIAGFGAAARVAQETLGAAAALSDLRDALEDGLLAMAPDVKIYGKTSPRLPNTSCFALPGLAAETQVMRLDLDGIAVSAGSACSSGKVTPSHVLRAMGASDRDAGSAIRVSFGWQSKMDDVAAFLKAWGGMYEKSHAA